jgi:hypothetical protein
MPIGRDESRPYEVLPQEIHQSDHNKLRQKPQEHIWGTVVKPMVEIIEKLENRRVVLEEIAGGFHKIWKESEEGSKPGIEIEGRVTSLKPGVDQPHTDEEIKDLQEDRRRLLAGTTGESSPYIPMEDPIFEIM